MQLKRYQLYHARVLPEHWVATDAAGNPWIFPARANGWDGRARYVGHRPALIEVDNINAVGTGWLPAEKNDARVCHGCGRDLDPHAPERVVFCGRCGDAR